MARLSLAAALAVVASRAATAQSPSCPCLTAATWPILGTDANGNPANRVLVGGQVRAYPAAYGIGSCAAHDRGLAPFCDGANPAAFCAEPWCYVDPTTCRDSTVRFAESTLLLDGENRAFYSYATCGGDHTSWESHIMASTLSGRTLRAAVAVPYYYPDHYVETADGEPVRDAASYASLPAGAAAKGLWVDLYSEMARRANFTLAWQPVSGGSKGQHSSSFTACTQDVADGIADLCVGDYWTTQERLSMTTFTTGTLTDTFSLIHPAETTSAETFWERLLLVWRPFDDQLWLAIFCTALCTGAAYSLVRGPSRNHLGEIRRRRRQSPEDADASDETVGRKIGSDTDETVPPALRRSPTFYTLTAAHLRGLVENTFGALVELTGRSFRAGGAPADEGVESIETAAVQLAWSVMSTFVVMLYAASLTAKLVGRRERFVGITTMEQCEKSRCTVCVPSVMEPTMRRLHENRINYHVSTSSTNVFRDLEDGACDLGLMIERRFNTMWSSGEFPAETVCKYRVGASIMPIGISQPVRSTYASAVSYWAKRVSDDDYFLGDLIENVYMPAPPCDMKEVDPLLLSVGLEEFTGPLGLYGALLIGAGVLGASRRWRKRSAAHRAEEHANAHATPKLRSGPHELSFELEPRVEPVGFARGSGAEDGERGGWYASEEEGRARRGERQ